MSGKRGYSVENMNSLEYFEKLQSIPDEKIHLSEAALQIAKDEYPELDIDYYLDLLANWGNQLKRGPRGSILDRVEKLNEFLFGQMNFEGNLEHYYDPKNSFLNDVIDSKKGIPITLSVIYLDLARRMGLNAAGVGFPGHFLVSIASGETTIYLDAFHKGKIMNVEGCVDLLQKVSSGSIEFEDSFLHPLDKKRTLSRILRNLKGIYLEQGNDAKLVVVMDKIVALNDDDPQELRDRGIVHYKRQAFMLALKDFEKYLSMIPEDEDSEMVRQYVEILRDYSNHLN
jgi:regulator of sirC expression with transglutaminase-like and TPR domain